MLNCKHDSFHICLYPHRVTDGRYMEKILFHNNLLAILHQVYALLQTVETLTSLTNPDTIEVVNFAVCQTFDVSVGINVLNACCCSIL